MVNKKTFIEITNKEIYEKLCSIEDRVVKTNGKVKLNRWMCTTALTLIVVVLTIISR